jgi:hypothetical protein
MIVMPDRLQYAVWCLPARREALQASWCASSDGCRLVAGRCRNAAVIVMHGVYVQVLAFRVVGMWAYPGRRSRARLCHTTRKYCLKHRTGISIVNGWATQRRARNGRRVVKPGRCTIDRATARWPTQIVAIDPKCRPVGHIWQLHYRSHTNVQFSSYTASALLLQDYTGMSNTVAPVPHPLAVLGRKWSVKQT